MSHRRNRRRSQARALSLPTTTVGSPVRVAPRPCAGPPKPGPPPRTSVAPGPEQALPAPRVGCCAVTRTRRSLAGGGFAIVRRHEPRCPVWSAR
ncbi:hypothetical protein [Kitasatospora sp. NPDC094015]|uniref:hypothetical protein n=1 Tax=Kitasatospora sp. NPDC094015 TaxID=3155205 RepID=UPI0033268D33